MTVQNTSIRKAGPSACNGITTAFPFTFKVFLTSDVVVTYTNLSAVEVTLTLGTDYTVTLNSDQNTTPGGTVTLLTAPASGTYITLTSQVTNTQNLALTNAGGFYPTSINDALDRVVILIQQLAEQVSRSVKVSVSSTTNPDQFVSSVATSAASSAASAASSLASLNEFKGVYYGSYASAPATDPLGNAIAAGDMYYNTASQSLQIYTSTGWQATAQATPVSYSSQTFNGTGAQTAFTLSSAPATLVATEVFISGVRQRPTTDYTISGTTLTFVSAPATGTNNIFVRWTYAIAVGVPNDGSVTTAKLANDLILPGNPSAATPAQFDNDTSLATTAFVQRASGNFSNFIGYATSQVLTAANMGNWIAPTVGALTFTLPAASSVSSGSTITIFGNGLGATIQRAGTDIIGNNGAGVTSLALGIYDTIQLTAGGTIWYTTYHDFNQAGSLGANGYQRLPNGLILQWGIQNSVASSASFSPTFPIAFPTNCLFAIYIPTVLNLVGQAAPVVSAISQTSFTGWNETGVTNNLRWFALGN